VRVLVLLALGCGSTISRDPPPSHDDPPSAPPTSRSAPARDVTVGGEWQSTPIGRGYVRDFVVLEGAPAAVMMSVASGTQLRRLRGGTWELDTFGHGEGAALFADLTTTGFISRVVCHDGECSLEAGTLGGAFQTLTP